MPPGERGRGERFGFALGFYGPIVALILGCVLLFEVLPVGAAAYLIWRALTDGGAP